MNPSGLQAGASAIQRETAIQRELNAIDRELEALSATTVALGARLSAYSRAEPPPQLATADNKVPAPLINCAHSATLGGFAAKIKENTIALCSILDRFEG